MSSGNQTSHLSPHCSTLHFPERAQLASQLGAGAGAETGVEGTFDLRQQHVRAIVGGAATLRDGCTDRAAIIGVGNPSHEAIGFEPIDKLRDIGLATAVSLREMRKRERLRGEHEVAQRAELGERKAYLSQGDFGTRLHGAGGVEQKQCEGASGGGGGAATI